MEDKVERVIYTCETDADNYDKQSEQNKTLGNVLGFVAGLLAIGGVICGVLSGARAQMGHDQETVSYNYKAIAKTLRKK